MGATSQPASALIVNDDPVQLRLAATILARDGFEVVSCHSAEEGLRLLNQRGSVDVVVTDLYMPGIDGWSFCRLLRSSSYERFNRIPILVVSATFCGADAEELTAQLGADGFLPAPYEAADLRRMAHDLIDNAKPIKLARLLVVSANAVEAEKLTDHFSANGYSVDRAVDGDEALRRYRNLRPQIVILDYDCAATMADGWIETLKGPAAASVVIVMTENRAPELTLELIRKGADNCVHKPVAPEYLLHLCETAARQRALLRVEELLELRTRRLRESEERYRSLFENAGDGIATYSLDGIVIGVNHELESMARKERADIVGKSYGRLMTDASFAVAAALQEQARLKQETAWTYEMDMAQPNGAVMPVEARCRYLPGKDSQPSMIMAMYRDITAKKKLDRERAEFAAMLAHDIRNPVGLILGCISLLLDDPAETIPALSKKWHYRILAEARLLESLVNNYLDVSTIEAGQLRISKKPLDLGELLQRVAQRYESESETRSIRLELHTTERPRVDGDGLALERVFGNLLQNALKFTPDGGRIRLSLAVLASEAVARVEDNGAGIDQEQFSRLFEKFQYLENSERRHGLGLGLHIVKELVTAHGGRVEVESQVGRGSCFSVFLPLAEATHETR